MDYVLRTAWDRRMVVLLVLLVFSFAFFFTLWQSCLRATWVIFFVMYQHMHTMDNLGQAQAQWIWAQW